MGHGGMYALAELVESSQIFTWLRQENPAVLRPKLMRSLSGSLDPADERATNNVGRNTIFELSLASEWRRAGLDVVIGEPDLRLILGPQEFAVERKRGPSRLWSARSGGSTAVFQSSKPAQ